MSSYRVSGPCAGSPSPSANQPQETRSDRRPPPSLADSSPRSLELQFSYHRLPLELLGKPEVPSLVSLLPAVPVEGVQGDQSKASPQLRTGTEAARLGSTYHSQVSEAVRCLLPGRGIPPGTGDKGRPMLAHTLPELGHQEAKSQREGR